MSRLRLQSASAYCRAVDVARSSTREIARTAVRDELARTAFPLMCSRGFDAVTFEDLASAAGVSRSTFLRHFGSKEEVVLFTFDPLGDAMVDVVRVRPGTEPDWVALRRALDPVVAHLTGEPGEGLALLRLVGQTPALCARLREKQAGWRPQLVQALAERSGPRPASSLALHARAAAAMECLMAALEHWVADQGHDDLDRLLDEAFGALTTTRREDSPTSRRETRRQPA